MGMKKSLTRLITCFFMISAYLVQTVHETTFGIVGHVSRLLMARFYICVHDVCEHSCKFHGNK